MSVDFKDEVEESEEEPKKKGKVIYPKSRIFIEFYQGVLLAVEDLSKHNINLELIVYDTENDSVKTKSLVEKEEFSTLDMIIGPIYNENLKIVANKAKEYKINMVSPLSNHDDFLKENLYAYQVNPTYELKEKF